MKQRHTKSSLKNEYTALRSRKLLYICYIYSDIEVGLCLKALVTHLALGHVARARVILM
jgi:hypothetical protein